MISNKKYKNANLIILLSIYWSEK